MPETKYNLPGNGTATINQDFKDERCDGLPSFTNPCKDKVVIRLDINMGYDCEAEHFCRYHFAELVDELEAIRCSL